MEPFIYIFGREIPIYGIAWMLGIAVSAVIAVFLIKKNKIERYDFVYCSVFAVIGGIIGAKLLKKVPTKYLKLIFVFIDRNLHGRYILLYSRFD